MDANLEACLIHHCMVSILPHRHCSEIRGKLPNYHGTNNLCASTFHYSFYRSTRFELFEKPIQVKCIG